MTSILLTALTVFIALAIIPPIVGTTIRFIMIPITTTRFTGIGILRAGVLASAGDGDTLTTALGVVRGTGEVPGIGEEATGAIRIMRIIIGHHTHTIAVITIMDKTDPVLATYETVPMDPVVL
jgi:hypothetical protein